tara:strand:+ start:1772 stop:2275 length:504 start_codon:yes stop_codon:yes gene_type:complete
MRNVLIILIVVLVGYLGFEQFNNNDNTVVVVEQTPVERSVTASTKPNKNKPAPEVLYQFDTSNVPATQKFDSEFISATYAVTLDNDHTKAQLRFTFNDDGTFTDYRDMTHPKSMAGETTGTYTIHEALITLIYAQERDTNVFKFNRSQMSLHKDGTLRTGTIVLAKQ